MEGWRQRRIGSEEPTERKTHLTHIGLLMEGVECICWRENLKRDPLISGTHITGAGVYQDLGVLLIAGD
jgi:hypothetical protein